IGVARTGAFEPLWSPRILEEWARAVERNLPGERAVAEAEIALLRAGWPEAEIAEALGIARDLWLPDADDVHVLAAAITARADEILTLNVRDFPARTLAPHGIVVRHPDTFLLEIWHADPDGVERIVGAVHARAEEILGKTIDLRAMLKRSRLPRLGKALARGAG
ncbi:MAG: PIN domain-containing protein, partial [Alphaproteobacteria bacterium]|nr:PIN domain-containing protein [Alphaproteobacteria bacterium]